MTTDCCAVPEASRSPSSDRCPLDGAPGSPVRLTTVAAQVRGALAEPQEYRVCKSAGCPVVYFGSMGAVSRVEDLWVAPGFKESGSDLVCYCFRKTRVDLADDLRENGESRLFPWIKDRVAAGGCACEVRNPTGRCCLSDVARELRAIDPQTPRTSEPRSGPTAG